MSQFYARYVPPTSATTTSSATAQHEKRKRGDAEANQGKKRKDKKRRVTDNDGDELSQANGDSQALGEPPKKPIASGTLQGPSILPKYSASRAATQDDASVNKCYETEAGQDSAEDPPLDGDVTKATKKKKTRQKSPKLDALNEDHAPGKALDHGHDKKHAGVLSKFSKAKSRSDAVRDVVEKPANDATSTETHGLEPIPQPHENSRPKDKPVYSTLPKWQTHAVKVVHRDTKLFEDLGMSKISVQNLQRSGIERSFPIQTTVLPLLLQGKERHAGDVCVSAATGSGKTLAYVLPVIEDLKEYPNTKLRGVVVVPTRELVKQVRQMCDICSAGTNLKIATAAGSKSLKEEQASLVLEEEIYDPEEYQRQQQAPVDWSSISIEQLLKDSATDSASPSIDYSRRFRSRIDILITTPGRLVDHLQSTPGFNLDFVKWLVVDEADRLLNESYQEWIDFVVPALQTQAATRSRDELLRSMRMKVPERVVHKVLLSATMTRDISKLNSLGLVNPKLVVLGNAALEGDDRVWERVDENLDQGQAEQSGAFNLPSSLHEKVVPVKEGFEKPLYLLELLKTRILKPTANSSEHQGVIDMNQSSTDDSDSSPLTDSTSDSDSEPDASSTRTDRDSSFIRKPASEKPMPVSRSEQHRALIFTRSTASATRLSRLLGLLSPSLTPLISTLTRSTTSSSSSRRALRAFHSGRTAILVATDRASRGLDIPDLENVISYDIPSSALTYVHRVGRTARAGKEGTAWTLVEHREGAWFWREIGGKEGKKDGKKGKGKEAEARIVRQEKPKKVQLEVDVESEKERYEDALKQLGEEVRG